MKSSLVYWCSFLYIQHLLYSRRLINASGTRLCFFSLDTAKSLPKSKNTLWSASVGAWINWSIISSQESFRPWCLSLSDTCVFFQWTCCINVPIVPWLKASFCPNLLHNRWKSLKVTKERTAWTVEGGHHLYWLADISPLEGLLPRGSRSCNL